MRTLLCDVETNGLLDQLDKIHSLVAKDPDSLQVISAADRPGYTPIEDALKDLMTADRLVFHNGIRFDIRALQQVYPWFKIDESKIVDTLVLSRLIWPDLGDRDAKLIKQGKLPPKMRGSHGLEAWGIRLGLNKGDYKKEMEAKGLDPWSHWNQDMQDYCELDVEVTERLWNLIQSKGYSEKAIDLEMKFAQVIDKQIAFGFRFDVQGATELYMKLVARRQELDDEILGCFPDWYVSEGERTPKVNNSKMGYVKGCPFTKIKLQTFNPGSRQQIANRLIHLYGWEPQEATESGQAKVDETTLGALPWRPAQLMAERFMVEKRIGQLAEGAAGWLKLEQQGRIHGSVNTNGAVTGRCTHSHPNVAQVPSCGAPYGRDCRSLFGVDDGYVLIGADASGLELRCLAHYMARYDGGAYAKELLEGDIHTANQNAAGLPTRNSAKTFIYAYLYGAGDAKIGSIIGKGAAAGKRLKQAFLNKTPALKRLKDDVSLAVKARGHLKGIDGRILHVRSEHSALNTLLQSAGALLVKQATVFIYEDLTAAGYKWGEDWAMVAHVHDEAQIQARKEVAEEIAAITCEAFRKAGREFNWRCPLDAEAKIGGNWAQTH